MLRGSLLCVPTSPPLSFFSGLRGIATSSTPIGVLWCYLLQVDLQFSDLCDELDIASPADQNQLWGLIQALREKDLRIHAPHLLRDAVNPDISDISQDPLEAALHTFEPAKKPPLDTFAGAP